MSSKPRCISNIWFRLFLVVFLIIGLLVSACPAYFVLAHSTASNPGDLDPTFGNGGIVLSSGGPGDNFGYAVALQPDGKIVVAGAVSNGSDPDMALLRYSRSGNLDPTFGSAGIVTTPVGPAGDYAMDIALQPDGKIVVAGHVHYGSGNYDFAVLRYTDAGVLDPTFGSGGIVTTPVGSGRDQVYGMAVQPDSKIVVAGFTDNGSDYDFALLRYTTSGVLDPAFGSGGIVITPIGPNRDWARDIALQPDGKILVTGYTDNGSNHQDIVLARYTTSGALDTTFGSGGVVTTPVGTSDCGYAVALQPDSKIVVAGYAYDSGHPDFALLRYTTSGVLDPTFGSGGIVTTPIGSGNDTATSIVIQPDGKIVVAGLTDNGSNDDFALVRYTTSGDLDTAFGSDGIVTTFIGPNSDLIQSIVLQPDGKILAAGYTYNGSSFEIALARYYAYPTYPIYLPHVAR